MTGLTLERELLADVRAAVAAQVGLSFPAERAEDLERGIRAAAAGLALADPELLARRIVAGSLSPADRNALVDALTVSETYFRREPAAFEALEQVILPRLLAARAGTSRELRLWSAGCCTGEEAYSLAVTCLRAVPDTETWRIDILGTDLNERSLEKARRGAYGRWSFRGTPPWFVLRHCAQLDERTWQVGARERSMVHFEADNLAEPVPVGRTGSARPVDVIFCRNVIMYLTPAHQRAALERFHAALADDGVLVLSPAEGGLVVRELFTVEVVGEALVYRKAPPAPVVPAPAVVPQRAARRHHAPAHQVTPRPAPVRHAPAHRGLADHRLADHHRPADQHRAVTHHRHPGAADVAAAALAEARTLADQGRLEDAIPLCRTALAATAPDAAAAYLLATILGDLGRTDEEAAALRQAVTLAPDFVLAHRALAEIERRNGRDAAARHHLDRALAVLRTMGRDEVVPEADGLTAGRLAEILGRLVNA